MRRLNHATLLFVAILMILGANECALAIWVAGNNSVGSATCPNGGMRRMGSLGSFMDEIFHVNCVGIDNSHGYAYYGGTANNGRGLAVKLRLADMSVVSTMTLSQNDYYVYSMVIDPLYNFAYLGVKGGVVKVRLSDFTRVGAITLGYGEGSLLISAVIDPMGNFAYFGTGKGDTRKVFKVRLSDFTLVDALRVDENYLASAVIDSSGSYAYFGSYAGKVLKIRLSDFTQAGVFQLNDKEIDLESAALDSQGGYAFFGTGWQNYSSGRIIKVRLSDLTRVGAINLPDGYNLTSAIINSNSDFLYFGGVNNMGPGMVIKVRLSDFTRAGSLTLNAEESPLSGAVMEAGGIYAYFNTNVGVVKVAMTNKNSLHASKITLKENAVTNDLRFYSHAAKGNLRLAIYDNGAPKKLLWESISTANTTAGAWITIPIAKGTPSALALAPGTYWLAWQTDSTADVASYAAGASGCGWLMNKVYGNYPATIREDQISQTQDLWSEYLTYTPRRNAAQEWRRYGE